MTQLPKILAAAQIPGQRYGVFQPLHGRAEIRSSDGKPWARFGPFFPTENAARSWVAALAKETPQPVTGIQACAPALVLEAVPTEERAIAGKLDKMLHNLHTQIERIKLSKELVERQLERREAAVVHVSGPELLHEAAEEFKSEETRVDPAAAAEILAKVSADASITRFDEPNTAAASAAASAAAADGGGAGESEAKADSDKEPPMWDFLPPIPERLRVEDQQVLAVAVVPDFEALDATAALAKDYIARRDAERRVRLFTRIGYNPLERAPEGAELEALRQWAKTTPSPVALRAREQMAEGLEIVRRWWRQYRPDTPLPTDEATLRECLADESLGSELVETVVADAGATTEITTVGSSIVRRWWLDQHPGERLPKLAREMLDEARMEMTPENLRASLIPALEDPSDNLALPPATDAAIDERTQLWVRTYETERIIYHWKKATQDSEVPSLREIMPDWMEANPVPTEAPQEPVIIPLFAASSYAALEKMIKAATSKVPLLRNFDIGQVDMYREVPLAFEVMQRVRHESSSAEMRAIQKDLEANREEIERLGRDSLPVVEV